MATNKQSDKDYLAVIVQHVNNISRFEHDRIAVFKDCDLKLLAATERCAALFGFKSAHASVGLKLTDCAYQSMQAFADIFTEQDKEVLESKEAKTYISVANYVTGFQILELHKYPVINPETKNLLGVFCSAHAVELHKVPEFIWEHLRNREPMNAHIQIIDDTTKRLSMDYRFTPMELDVIFFYLLGYSPTEIAHVWEKHGYNLRSDGTPKTAKNIRDIKEQIASKLEKPELNQTNIFIDFFRKEGFHNYTPGHIFKKFMQFSSS